MTRTNPPCFLVDAMLGNVARDLRLLGYDAAFAGERTDSELLRQSQAQSRVLVTRDRALARRASPRGLFVHSARPAEQVVEVLRALRLAPRPSAALTRCLACNGLLRRLDPDVARTSVPDHVAHRHRLFLECPACDRVYWGGSHAPRLHERARRILASLHGREPPV